VELVVLIALVEDSSSFAISFLRMPMVDVRGGPRPKRLPLALSQLGRRRAWAAARCWGAPYFQ